MSQTVSSKLLRKDWHLYEVAENVDTSRPGIYEWHIEGVGSYIGQYTHIRRPTREYALNLLKMLNEKPYRKSKPDGFRRVHRELHRALSDNRVVTLRILLNADKPMLNQLERELIRARGVLND